ncbi:hypothetical protein MNJPNG_06240 [Cupriavidus oxalaticus]|uniref:H-NS family nucleoid-associated regulatory protein n=1 Tax=Cupriavidus oxalaticus TaxID=96344 RepID=UPI003F73EA24
MSNPQELVTIRVRDLVISPRNVRKTPSSTIRELAASIKHHGLLQPLTVIDVPAKGKKPGRTEVIAGGRRLRALQMLIEAGELGAEHRALCAVREADAAEEISVAENMHEAMHPADEFQAFKELIDAGSTAEEIAARFGVTPLTVQRRLKLANVSPRLVQGYRDGELNLDQLMALAITDDHAAQERVWERAKKQGPWYTGAAHLRSALAAPGAIDVKDDRLARFVGLDAYEAAGGPVVRDLFSDGGGFIGDAKLLQHLADEKLQAVAERLRAEGWSWVEVVDRFGYSEESVYGRSQPKKRTLTEAEAADLATLKQRAKELDERNDALDVEDDALLEELAQVEASIEHIEGSLEIYSDRQKAKAGAVATIRHNGELQIYRGLINPETGKKQKDTRSDTAGPDGSTAAAPDEAAERPLSERMVTTLTAHRTAALQALVAQSPAVALVALLYAMVPQIFKALSPHRYSAVAKVSLTNNCGCGQQGTDLEGSRAWVSLEDTIGRWEERLPGEGEDLFAWLQGLSQADQLDLLAVCVAHSINTVEHREDSAGHEHAHQLAAAVDLDMTDWWQATAGSYLASVPKSRRIEAVREAAGEEAANAIAGMKKDAMIAAAEQRLEGQRWLPAILRRPGAPASTAAPAPSPANAAPPAAPTVGADKAPIVKRAPVRYRDENGNTWTGRGKRPGWVEAALKAGKTLDELLATDAREVEA